MLSLNIVLYLKDGNAAVASFKKAHARCCVAGTKKKKKVGNATQIPAPASKAGKVLLSIGAGAPHDVYNKIDDTLALRGPCSLVLPAKSFQDIAGMKGTSSHLKWLTKELEGEECQQACYVSPFPSKPSLLIAEFLKKHIPATRLPLPGSDETRALRESITDVPALGMTAKHVYHGINSFGTHCAHLLVKGEYLAFGAPSSFFTGSSLNAKIHALIQGNWGEVLKKAVMEKKSDVWFFHHQTPGTVFIIPSGHVYTFMGHHDADKSNVCCVLRSNFMDVNNKDQHTSVSNAVTELVKSYLDIAEGDRKAWQTYIGQLPIASL